jgi:low temperature requirement protein LtrA
MAQPRKAEPRKRGLRWGLLTLLFLGIVVASIIASNLQQHYTVLTLLGLIVGFGGAGYCSWQGLKGFSWLPR